MLHLSSNENHYIGGEPPLDRMVPLVSPIKRSQAARDLGQETHPGKFQQAKNAELETAALSGLWSVLSSLEALQS